ncbi:methylated-DNA--[protein]-cysteine S-methyltransferase [Spiroplasma endosymbiont of Diplazon laetatorius]|uniref:methylated-DNA--[protein]-cysteine S-methyltransferase n=1 Tax=Spiroplasma endosymbiont of Diplazon laetatorius TaxID=3066322 RepID=UPI0030D1144F
MEEKIIKVFKITIFKNKVLKIGLIEDKLSYIGFEKDNIHEFYKGYKVRNILKSDEFKKYIDLIRRFENKQDFKLDFNSLFLPNLTDKQIHVLREVCNLDYGEYVSYSDFAKKINMPDHTRFIASCMAKNPILLLIPCHRLISKNQDVKYRSGREIKQFLINEEY